MNAVKFNKSLVVRHLISWLLIIAVTIIIIPAHWSPFNTIFLGILRILVVMLCYYSVSFIAAPIFHNKKYQLFILVLLIIYIIYYMLFYLVDVYFSHFIFGGNPNFFPILKWSINTTIYFLALVLLGFGFFESNIIIQHIERENYIHQTNMLREIMFFRNQFNHHISFNFLNYCYSYVQKNEKSAFIIETYSNMLRYTLDTKPAQPVPVQKEIQYLEQFIALQKELGKNIAVQFITTGVKEKIFILPCILITFVENAFKFGICNDNKLPIKIILSLKPNALEFLVENHIATTLVLHKSNGIGQINAVRHLELYYKKDYVLNINQDDNIYKVQLQINFKS